MVRIEKVIPKTHADLCGIKEKDILISINGKDINDVLDYRFYLAEENINLLIKRNDDNISFSINKECYDDIGLEFETPLMDKKHRCENKCIFCFIDQLPKGLRESLYFKDDDSRLSFLHGNYITLTNLEKRDIERIIEMHISPVNVSVHTTNPELRCKMMHNKKAGTVLEYLDMLANGGIDICAQIVLCRGINDGEELNRSLNDLAKLYPRLSSVAIVPSGLTKFREGLYPLKPFDKSSAKEVIKTVEKINALYAHKLGKNIFFCSDEFYLLAEKKMHNEAYYEGYSQLDNGVGMITSFEEEAYSFIKTLSSEEKSIKRSISVATGTASYPFISKLVKRLQRKCKGLDCKVYEIMNDFFGHTVTVSGLITGVDLINQLAGNNLGNELYISKSMLRADGDLFLCGTSILELESELNVKIVPVEQDGASFVASLLGIKEV